MASQDQVGMQDLTHVANVPWCVKHDSFALNIPSAHDGGSCIVAELALNDSTEPQSLVIDCDFVTARVAIPGSDRTLRFPRGW